VKKRRRKRARNFLINTKIEDERGNVILKIDDNLKEGIRKIMRLCEEKFSIDWKKL